MNNKKIYRYMIIILFLGILTFLAINTMVIYKANKYILNKESHFPKVEALLVPGAYVYPDGRPSDILKDRLDTALEVLEQDKNMKILVTGDHGTVNYDEVNAMRKYLEKNGVDTSNIFMDHAGFSTYESIYRAKEIFQVESAILVTQSFHLKRAVYNARKIGINAYGIEADKHIYVDIFKYQIRESLARCKDFLLVNYLKTKPKFLGEKIPISSSDGVLTHDKK
ncbi:ElyC/SanA/YdcF family protein [Clostridium sediminicola]|uniref:SanA/YdcF family protein n=1 Tax=Clostridium sediminicola TaxID=3114879 RepID=UPI0031F25653